MGQRHTGWARIGVAAVALCVLGGLAGCTGSPSPASSAPAPGNTTRPPGTASPQVTAATPVISGAFVPIVEPFDPGHPAQAKPSPADCGSQESTLAIEQCYEAKTESADAAIDTVQQSRYQGGSTAQQAAITAEDGAWLAARKTVCAMAYRTGGTIDGINVAGCLLDESTARLDAVKGIRPPEAVLKATDDTNFSDLSWYTTPEGSRIATIDTQGDPTGGVIIAWVILAGAHGFVVNPAQFYFRDGSFTDRGTIRSSDPSGYRVAPGTEYQFNVDYRHLPADPNGGKSGGWVYAPGAPLAVWR
jgi:uncharacterized protein YecT (DUF1311 family)